MKKRLKSIIFRFHLVSEQNFRTRFFLRNAFFPTEPQCLLYFLSLELHVLLRCCVIQTIIILTHFLYLLYLSPYLDLGLVFLVPVFMLHICDLFFFSIFIFISIDCIISLIQTHLFFCLFFMSYYF